MGIPLCGQFHSVQSERYCLDCINIGLWKEFISETRRANDRRDTEPYEEQPRKERTRYQESTYKPPEPQVPKVVRRTE